MKRLFPAPLLSIALMALWLMLNRSYGPGQWLLGALLGWLLPLWTRSLRPTRVHMRKPWVAIKLLFTVAIGIHEWNWRVLRGTFARPGRAPKSGFVTVPLDLRDPNGLAALAAILCVIPGTIWSELAVDRSALLVHVFELDDPQTEIDQIKSRYERPLMEIFE